MRLRKNVIHVAERAFVQGAYTLSGSLATLASVHFAIPTEVAKHLKRVLSN